MPSEALFCPILKLLISNALTEQAKNSAGRGSTEQCIRETFGPDFMRFQSRTNTLALTKPDKSDMF